MSYSAFNRQQNAGPNLTFVESHPPPKPHTTRHKIGQIFFSLKNRYNSTLTTIENAQNATENAKNVTENAATREIIEGQSDGFCRLKQRSNSETRSVSLALINSSTWLCHRLGETKREKKYACPLILAVIKSVIREMVNVGSWVLGWLVFPSLLPVCSQ